MTWARGHRRLLIAAVVTFIAGALSALAYRAQLTIAADIAGAPFSAWDVVVSTSQDPFVISYFVWPVLVLLVGYGISLRARPAVLLRWGSRSAFVLSEALQASVAGAGLAMALLLSSLAGTAGLSWEMAWSPLAIHGGQLVESLSALAAARLAFVPILAAQVLYVTVAAAALGAGIALTALLLPRHFRVMVIVIAFVMPVLFKAWPLPLASNPINALLTYHAVMSGLPLWAPPTACLAGVAGVGALASGVDRHPTWSLPSQRIEPRWAWYAAVVGIGIALMTPGQDPELPLAMQLLYGASTEGLSFVHWAFAVITWVGLALVLMLRWSNTLTARLPYLLLRHGRATSLVIRESARDLLAGVLVAAVLVGVTTILDLATRRPLLSWADTIHLLLAAPLVSATLTLAAVIAAWLVHSLTPMTVALVTGGIVTLPVLNPAWPWPTGLAFLGARPVGTSPLVPVLLAAATWAAAAAVLTLVARHSAPSFD